MNQRTFEATQWLKSASKKLAGDTQIVLKPESHFQLSEFLIPGWKGEGLISRSGLAIHNITEELCLDAVQQYESFYARNRSFKQLIYQEYVHFLKDHAEEASPLNEKAFWEQNQLGELATCSLAQEFKQFFCFRAVILYLYKIKFLTALCDCLNIGLVENYITNPSSFFSRIFKRHSSTELLCDSLHSHSYSWYRPTSNFSHQAFSLAQNFDSISVSELLKVCTYKARLRGKERSKLDFKNSEYSHSLSHLSFGLFVNTLLLNFTTWLEEGSPAQDLKYFLKRGKFPEVLNCKFTGDKMNSFCHSHWLAQEHNLAIPWKEIINPIFKSYQNADGHFFKYCQELQFLSFLTTFARKQSYPVLELICNTMREKYKPVQGVNSHGQISFNLFPTEPKSSSHYQRVLLNLSDLPKKNPHHYMLSKIQAETEQLDEDGYAIVFSPQKLFVPSQTKRVAQFLEDFKLKLIVQLNKLQGRGEIPGYIYILKKRKLGFRDEKPFYAQGEPHKKESLYRLFLCGDLNRFNRFHQIVEHLEQLIGSKQKSQMTIYQKEIDNNLTVEIHQDVVVQGKLLSSYNNGNKDQITHPNFFKNVTQSCAPLDSFFQVHALEKNDESVNEINLDILGINLTYEKRYPLLLIVNHSSGHSVSLELTTMDLYEAKSQEYGHALFQYFGLTPKKPNMNLNLFREYFQSQVGRQVVQLSLNGGMSKTRAKLKSLLIPKFFSDSIDEHHSAFKNLSLLGMTSEEILLEHPHQLKEQHSALTLYFDQLIDRFPKESLNRLMNFKFQLKKVLSNLGQDSISFGSYNFANPLFIEKLITLNTHPLYPHNKDIYIEFYSSNPRDIHLPLTHQSLGQDEKGHHSLELFSEQTKVITLNSDPNFLSFISFIMTSMKGQPLAHVIQSLRVPRMDQFGQILQGFEEVQQALTEISEINQQLIEKTFQTTLLKAQS